MMKILKATFLQKDQWKIDILALANDIGSQIFSVFKDEEKGENTIFFCIQRQKGKKIQTSPSLIKSFHLQSLQSVDLSAAIEATEEDSTFGRFLREMKQKKRKKIWFFSRMYKVRDFLVK